MYKNSPVTGAVFSTNFLSVPDFNSASINRESKCGRGIFYVIT